MTWKSLRKNAPNPSKNIDRLSLDPKCNNYSTLKTFRNSINAKHFH